MNRSTLVLIVAAPLLLQSCGTSPPRQYYTLEKSPASRGGMVVESAAAPYVILGPVTLPDIVDRSQIVLRTGTNQVEISDIHRWAEPLRGQVATVLAASLSRHLDNTPVAVQGQATAGDADLRVAVDILRFDAVPGASTVVEAAAAIHRRGQTTTVRCRLTAREAVRGPGYPELVGALSRTLADLGRDLAACTAAASATADTQK